MENSELVRAINASARARREMEEREILLASDWRLSVAFPVVCAIACLVVIFY